MRFLVRIINRNLKTSMDKKKKSVAKVPAKKAVKK